MALPPLLEIAVPAIIDRALERLQSRTAQGKALQGVKTVVRGDEVSRDGAKLAPSIWVHGVVGTADADRRTMVQEAVNMRLVLTAIARSSKPESGSRLSQRLALRALYELRHDDNGEWDPTLGFDWVDDVTFDRFELSTGESKGGIYGSALQPIVKFRVSRTS